MIPITPDISIDERDLEGASCALRGQAARTSTRLATAVEAPLRRARIVAAGSVKHRLAAIAGSRLTADGVLLIDSREHRTQTQNRDAARARLVALLQKAAIRPRKRRPTKPNAGAKEKRLESKKRRGIIKARRSAGGDE